MYAGKYSAKGQFGTAPESWAVLAPGTLRGLL